MAGFGILAAVAWPIVAIIWIGVVYSGWRQDRNEKKQLAEANITPLKKKITELEVKIADVAKKHTKYDSLESDLNKLATKVNMRD